MAAPKATPERVVTPGQTALRSGRGMRLSGGFGVAVALHLLLCIGIIGFLRLRNPFVPPEPPNVGVLPYQAPGNDLGGQPVEEPADQPQDITIDEQPKQDNLDVQKAPEPSNTPQEATPDVVDNIKKTQEAIKQRTEEQINRSLDDVAAALRKKLAEAASKPAAGGADGDYADRPGPEAWGRWTIVFSVPAVDEYARILDFFHAEVGVSYDGSTMTYFSHFSQGRPTVRKASVAEERRMHWFPANSRVSPLDEALIRQAGHRVQGIVLQFYPVEVERTLAALEKERAAQSGIRPHKTIFGIRRSSAGYEFYVIRQF